MNLVIFKHSIIVVLFSILLITTINAQEEEEEEEEGYYEEIVAEETTERIKPTTPSEREQTISAAGNYPVTKRLETINMH